MRFKVHNYRNLVKFANSSLCRMFYLGQEHDRAALKEITNFNCKTFEFERNGKFSCYTVMAVLGESPSVPPLHLPASRCRGEHLHH